MSKAESLYRLQLLDNQLDGAVKRTKEIDVALAGNAAVAHAKAELEKAEKMQRSTSAELKSLELDAQTLDTKIAEEEKRLYSGAIKISKELLETQKEVDSLKKRRGGLDDGLLTAMEQAEDAESALKRTQQGLNDALRKWTEDNQHMRQEREMLTANIAALREQRQAAVVSIPRSDLDLYVALRAKKTNGVAVSLIKNGSCGQCGEAPSSIQLQQARVGTSLTTCTNCGRILYGM